MKDKISNFLRKVQAITVDNEFRRFEQVLDSQGLALFPNVTCIVDGVPVYCRGGASYYNGKKKG